MPGTDTTAPQTTQPPAERALCRHDSGATAKALFTALQSCDLIAHEALDAPVSSDPDSLSPPERMILYTRPRDWLADAIQQGRSPAGALKGWSAETRAIMNLYRHHRQQVHLLDSTMVIAHPDGLDTLLPAGLPAGWSPDLPAPPDPGLVALAEAMLARSPQALRLAGELVAATRIPDPDSTDPSGEGFDPDELASRCHEQRRRDADLRDEIARLTADLQQARTRYADLHDSYDRARHAEVRQNRKNQELASMLEGLTTQKATLEERARQAEETLAQMRTERDSYRDQTHGLQAELDQAGASLEHQNGQVEALRGELAGMEQLAAEQQAAHDATRTELERVLQSRSLRLTHPLRRLRALLIRD